MKEKTSLFERTSLQTQVFQSLLSYLSFQEYLRNTNP